MKLLLDNGLPRGAVGFLQAGGIEAVHVGTIGLADASDSTILKHALANGCTIVTLDADFHTLLSITGASGPSTIRIRVEGLRAAELADLILKVICRFGEELREGAAISVGNRGARCHLLPIGSQISHNPHED